MTINQKQYVMLDRDGTIIKECHYLSDPDQVELLPNTVAGLQLLSQRGFGLVVITNQSGVGRGYYDLDRLASIHQRLESLLGAEDIVLDGIYFCPHTPADDCDCRKPRTGMALQAAADLNITLSDSHMVGDKHCDIEVGQRVGATTYLVRTGYGIEAENALESGRISPDYVVDDLYQMARMCVPNL